MKKQKLIPSLLMIGLMMPSFVSTLNVSASLSYGGGSGTESDPYLISTPEHLNQLQLDVNVNGVDTAGKYYRLTNNIDLSGYDNDSDPTNGNFTPIGSDSSATFKGTFDGNNKVISNLKIILPNQYNVGFFGNVRRQNIQNIGLENVLIEGKNNVGGLIGYQYYGTVNRSYTTGSINGEYHVGGLVGSKYEDGYIFESYSLVNVNGDAHIGGLVGYMQDGGAIEKSFAMGDVSGDYYVGGLIGTNGYGKINGSYSTGKVSGNSDTGGLIGWNDTSSSMSENSYWDIESSGQNQAIGSGYTSNNAVGLTTTQMIGEAAKTNMANFNFETVWKTTNKYPQFQWQPEETTESTDTLKDVIVNGTVQTMVANVVIPSVSPDLVINPNLEEGYVSPEFSILNDSVSPIKLELKTFEQVTDTFNDVLPSKYNSWVGLNKHQSQDIALGLVAKEGEGWQSLTTPTSYVANHTEHEIGVIKPTSSVDFSFDVKHGTAFSEAKTVQYKMVFVFDLMN